ncbi:MAG: hypothetical protein D6744_04460, partial [Planctomycetota bacterium]
GEDGTLHWNMNDGRQVLKFVGGESPERLDPPDGTGWTRELDYFIDCVLAGTEPRRCPPNESRRAIQLLHCELESNRAGGAPVRPAESTLSTPDKAER